MSDRQSPSSNIIFMDSFLAEWRCHFSCSDSYYCVTFGKLITSLNFCLFLCKTGTVVPLQRLGDGCRRRWTYVDGTQDSGNWHTVAPPEEGDSYPFLKGLKDQVRPTPKGTPARLCSVPTGCFRGCWENLNISLSMGAAWGLQSHQDWEANLFVQCRLCYIENFPRGDRNGACRVLIYNPYFRKPCEAQVNI